MPGPTAYEYAQMCVAVYTRAGHRTQIEAKRGSWQFLTSSPMNDFGYYGAVYRNVETRQIVIAHCGTDANVFTNLRADLQIAVGRQPVAYQFVAGFSDRIYANYDDDGYEITETGHSLGAIYAELNAIRLRRRAVTFESPGSRDLVAELPVEVDIINYLSAPNFINTSGGHIGTIIRLYPPHVESTGFRVQDVVDYGRYLALFFANPNYLSTIAALTADIFKYTQRLHSMEALLAVFDSNLHAPKLQSQPTVWPSRLDFLNSTLWTYLHPVGKYRLYSERFFPWLLEAWNSLVHGGEGRTVAKNIRLEDNLHTFIANCPRPQGFLMPSAEHCEGVSIADMRLFVDNSRQELLTFYNPDAEAVQHFDRDLTAFMTLNGIIMPAVAGEIVGAAAPLDIVGDYDDEDAVAPPASSGTPINTTFQMHGVLRPPSPRHALPLTPSSSSSVPVAPPGSSSDTEPTAPAYEPPRP